MNFSLLMTRVVNGVFTGQNFINVIGCEKDVGGQSVSCPYVVFVRILRKIVSGVCLLSGFCLDFLSGVCLSGFYLPRFCQLSGFCPDLRKKIVRCLSVQPDKDETELSGLSLSFSADVCPTYGLGLRLIEIDHDSRIYIFEKNFKKFWPKINFFYCLWFFILDRMMLVCSEWSESN